MATRTLDPKSYVLLVGDQRISGINSVSVSFPNDEVTIVEHLDGSVTFAEATVPDKFELTVSVGSAHAGNNILTAVKMSKTYAPITFTNLRGMTALACLKARVILVSFGQPESGADTPTEWKIIGVADVVTAGGEVDFEINLEALFPPITPVF